ncbi:MAG: hypothetical protein WCP39_01965 [Chlamydiota bacterium]
MNCWKCKATLDLLEKKISFRAECPHCGVELHVCKNCCFYCVGKPNDCFIPDIEKVVDKERRNFCEEFSPLKESASSDSTSKPSRSSLGEIPKKKTFDSLFKD